MNRETLKTVLYVDDEPDIREVVELSLGLVGGLAVHTCDSGDRALQILPQLRPDLILLDVMMPRLDGPSTLQRLRSRFDLSHGVSQPEGGIRSCLRTA